MSPAIALPSIIQGGTGAGVSGWRLAQAVSSLGQLGVVSGTGLDTPGSHAYRRTDGIAVVPAVLLGP